jgi:SAM-dependent MidA family methyltransferase
MSGHDANASQLPLAVRLRDLIRRDGPISFRDWMEAALYDERDGYYFRPDLKRWGRAGDYRTSPERSPLFAATFANYFSGLYESLGSPRQWTIVEAGAGAGHFAQGVLRTLRSHHPQVFFATRYVIDELSADARAHTLNRLSEFADRVEFRHLSELSRPLDEGIVFANELLDAFPVHRAMMHEGRLVELLVGLGEDDRFTWVKGEEVEPQLARHFAGTVVELSEGQIFEINPGVEEWMNRAAAIINRGYFVIVDYGALADDLYRGTHRRNGTLRAFRNHRFSDDPLSSPGEQDLTTTIDWSNVMRVAKKLGLQVESFERQDEFLLRAGLLDQLERMTAHASGETERLILRSGVRELILPGGLSESFQTLVLKREVVNPERLP